MKYVIYKRVSTTKQSDSGLGLAAQDRDIALFLDNYAEDGAEVIGTFTDILSGAENDRPELAKAIALSKTEGAELLVSKLDRLSRRVSTIAQLMEDKNLTLRVASMPNADNFQLHIYAALAAQEREFISRRTKAALREAKARGVKLGGLRDKTAARNAARMARADARANKVAPIVKPMRESGATLAQIAEALDIAKVETAQGGKWSATHVSLILKRLEAMASPSPA